MKDLAVKVDSYEKDGQTKNVYKNIGTMMEGEHGPYLLLDPSINLSGILIMQRLMNQKAGNRVLVSVFDKENKGGQQSRSGNDDFGDSIPFNRIGREHDY